ncbi:DUF932 domain-containing protein [Selenomonas ruminantium]|uniref:DUF932 domain-containing protein n=1 Tax=Selenomonas ruminantium TaxID=971 RepID=UPI00047B7A31|nr:DUF932 domain-containing protein [Selenomonas ruminantium]
MKQGRSLEELGVELQRQRNVRQDFVADSRKLTFSTGEGGSKLSMDMGKELLEFGVNPLAHQQISTRLGIPLKYYQRMQRESPALLDANVNNWLQQTRDRRMLRVMDGNVRAFLSDRYRRLDNLELCAAVFPIIKDMKGAVIESCEITDAHLYLKVINRRMKAEVAVGDPVQAGFVISNSEVGLGHLTIEPMIFRLVCKNGMICKDFSQKKRHVGRQVENYDTAYELYSDETLAQDDKAFFMKVADTVRCAVDESKFMLTVGKMQEAMNIPLDHQPMQEVELLADRFNLTENEQGDIFRQLFISGDNSRYGLLNAVTAASQNAADYERATELERIGGEILALPVKDIAPIALPAGKVTPLRKELAS